MNDEERLLWGIGPVSCVLIACCSGAELQVRRGREAPHEAGEVDIVLRELYPTKSDLYERSRTLQSEYAAQSSKGHEETRR